MSARIDHQPSTDASSEDDRRDRYWNWRGHRVRYQVRGEAEPGTPILCVHGFGASSDHFRKNIGPASSPEEPDGLPKCPVYAIDLLGFGLSDKPIPGEESGIRYTMETWGEQVADFCSEVIQRPTFLAANSIGGIVSLQSLVDFPSRFTGAALMNASLRLLSVQKAPTLPWYRRVGAAVAMKVLANRPVAQAFFGTLATPNTISKILKQAYGVKEAVDDELVNILLGPASTPGALDSFLSFIMYTTGPIPEELLPRVPEDKPVHFIWGEVDPWEPLELGRPLGDYPCVKDFVTLPGVGHCPQDEAPQLVNPLLRRWAAASPEPSLA